MAASRKTGNSTSRNTTGINAISGSMKGNSPEVQDVQNRAQSTRPQQTSQGANQTSQASGESSPAGRNGNTPEIQMTLNHDQIAQRAFAIWVARGKPMGQDQQNWADAERQLRQELARRA